MGRLKAGRRCWTSTPPIQPRTISPSSVTGELQLKILKIHLFLFKSPSPNRSSSRHLPRQWNHLPPQVPLGPGHSRLGWKVHVLGQGESNQTFFVWNKQAKRPSPVDHFMRRQCRRVDFCLCYWVRLASGPRGKRSKCQAKDYPAQCDGRVEAEK